MSAALRRLRSPSAILAILMLAYIVNFLDRQILGILAQPIKADLHLTDTEFGAVGGLAFALLYATLGWPLGILADRTSRGGVIAASVALWSGFTALCGSATSFGQLFLYRLGVGIGEAGGVAPSYALIADRFPARSRARALAIFSLGVPIGLALGTLIGAYVAKAFNWRIAFLVMGAFGILLAPIVWYITRDQRGPASTSPPPAGPALSPLLRKPSFWLLSLASAMSSLVGYGLAVWTPSVMMRSFGFNLTGTANFMASLLLIGGTSGMLAGGTLADRLSPRDRRWNAWLPAIAWTLSAPILGAGLMSDSLVAVWVLFLIANGLNILWFGPLLAAVQQLAPAKNRAAASGAYLFINNLVGLGIGPMLMGRISDGLRPVHGADSLRYASFYCLGFYFAAALLALWASFHLRGDWELDEPGKPLE